MGAIHVLPIFKHRYLLSSLLGGLIPEESGPVASFVISDIVF